MGLCLLMFVYVPSTTHYLMRKIIFLTSCLLFCFLFTLRAQEGSTKIKLKVKDADGRLIEKEYQSEEAFRNDPDLKDLGIEVDAKEGMIQMQSKGSGNRVVIMQSSSKGAPGDYAYSFDKDTEILMDDSLLYIFQGRFHSDSLEGVQGVTLKEMRGHREDMDSLRRERREEMLQRRDSLREVGRQYREEHEEEYREKAEERREAARERREEFRARMELMQERMEEMEVELEEGTRLIIIQELSREETDALKKKGKPALQLKELRFYPNPGDDELQLEFEASEAGPVTIQLLEANTNKIVYEESRRMQAGDTFQEGIDLAGFQPGWYRLQLSQNNKVLNRKVIIR